MVNHQLRQDILAMRLARTLIAKGYNIDWLKVHKVTPSRAKREGDKFIYCGGRFHRYC